jgi:ribosomal protein S18 acetylase RimI-like enzyme
VAVHYAGESDCQAILDLLQSSFDRYADQLPMLYEIEAAIEAQQILAVKCEGALAALLFFESQGFTSTVRYWVVAERFRSRRLGSILVRHYFAAQSAVRRFILWVTADNDNAILKYRHYGYAPDGLIDHVFVNGIVHP